MREPRCLLWQQLLRDAGCADDNSGSRVNKAVDLAWNISYPTLWKLYLPSKWKRNK